MKSRTLAPSGTFTEVAWSTGTWWATWQDGAQLIVVTISTDLTQVALWRTYQLGDDAGAFPRFLVWDGRLWLAYRKGGPSYAVCVWNVLTDEVHTLGWGYGNDPVALGSGFAAWQSTGDYQVLRQPIDGSGPTTHERIGAPTGLSRILLGQVITVDEDRRVVPGGTRPSWAGDAVAIEVDETAGGPCDLVRRNDGLEARVFQGQYSPTPRLATDGRGRYLLGTGQGPGVRVALIEAADFVAPVPVPVPHPEDDVLNAPGVTIDRWDQIIHSTADWKLTFHNRGNPEHGNWTVEIKNGFLTVALTNGVGDDRSGATNRHVMITP